MASAFCSQFRQYVKQIVSNPQPCLVNQTARLHVGDARNRFYNLLHLWSGEKPPEKKPAASGSLPLVLNVNDLKFVVLREDVAVPLQPPLETASGLRQLNARPNAQRADEFPEPTRADCRQQKEICDKATGRKPNYANPDSEPSSKPTPELEASPRSKPTKETPETPAPPGRQRPQAKPTGLYATPARFYIVKSPLAKMNDPLDYNRRDFFSVSSRNFSSVATNAAPKESLARTVKKLQITGFHSSARNNEDRRDRDRDRDRGREEDACPSPTPEGRTICAGKKAADQSEDCPGSGGRSASPRRDSDSRRSSDRRDGAAIREPDSRGRTSLSESESRRSSSVREPEWRQRTSMREPDSRGGSSMEEPRSDDSRSARRGCSGNEPWKRDCPGSNRLNKCPYGDCGRGGSRDPQRKTFSTYALQESSSTPFTSNLKSSRTEITRSLGRSSVFEAKKKSTCDDKYSQIKDKKKHMEIMEKEFNEIKNCIDSVKCKDNRSPKDSSDSKK